MPRPKAPRAKAAVKPENQRYVRMPTIASNTIVFCHDDDLWQVPSEGGHASRLTVAIGPCSRPVLSPDGSKIAFTLNASGQHDVYLMDALGGEAERITYLEAMAETVGWRDNDTLFVRSSHAFLPEVSPEIFEINLSQREPRKLPFGPAIHFDRSGSAQLLGRHTRENAFWKRYRGGTHGVIWVDRKGNGNFVRILPNLQGNIASPCFADKRIFFLSDHDGISNLYSCDLGGDDLVQHSQHQDFYARHLSSDGHQLVYTAGGQIWVMADGKRETQPQPIAISLETPAVQAQTRFRSFQDNLSDAALSPDNQTLAACARGQLTLVPPWYGGPVNLRSPHKIKRVAFADEKTVIASATATAGHDLLLWCQRSNPQADWVAKDLCPRQDWGKIWCISPSPDQKHVAVINNRNELWMVHVSGGKASLVEKNPLGRPKHPAWSPDGRYLAYDSSETEEVRAIRFIDLRQSGKGAAHSWKPQRLLQPILGDWGPVFDPSGRYLYFQSIRTLSPVYGNLHFEIGFPRTGKLYCVALQADLPLRLSEHLLAPERKKKEVAANAKEKGKSKGQVERPETVIHLEGIDERLEQFSLPEGGYFTPSNWGVGHFLAATKQSLFYLRMDQGLPGSTSRPLPSLYRYDFAKGEKQSIAEKVQSFQLSQDGQQVLLQTNDGVRLLPASGKPEDSGNNGAAYYSRQTGRIHLDRIKLCIHPREEWDLVLREAWYLQKEHFWTPDLSRVDWDQAFRRYHQLLPGISCRSELSDIIWEMQGELGTSHCYEFGGERFRVPPTERVGHLGVEVSYQKKAGGFRVDRVYRGDSGARNGALPVSTHSARLSEGDIILAIDGTIPDGILPLGAYLDNCAERVVQLKVQSGAKKTSRVIAVRALSDTISCRYRQWIDTNRRYVYQRSKGRLGYIHIPDMGLKGFEEFYRNFIRETQKEGLVIDVRYNRGGHVSELLLRQLIIPTLGYDLSRYDGVKRYPSYSMPGAKVCIINELAGSDGDIFPHAFKLLELGPVIGKRSWGGVIGINTRYRLIDGSVTSQPEFSFWFKDAGFSVENYGVDPDVEVEFSPQDWAQMKDPQLAAACDAAMAELAKCETPDFSQRPDLSWPRNTNKKTSIPRKGTRKK